MRVRLGTIADRLTDADGRSVVLVGQLALVISPLATAIVDTLARLDEIDVAVLAEVLVEIFGEPSDGQVLDLVAAQCRELAEPGIVTIVSVG